MAGGEIWGSARGWGTRVRGGVSPGMRKSQGVPGDRGPFMGWGSLLGSSGIAEPEGTHFGGGLWGSFGGDTPT